MQDHNNVMSMYMEPSSFMQPIATNHSVLPFADQRSCFQGVRNCLISNEMHGDNEVFGENSGVEEQFVPPLENMENNALYNHFNNWNNNSENMQTCGKCEEGDELRLEEWVEELMRDVSFLPSAYK